ncbi:MAG: DUF1501 domain-containing protein [Planctomycetota bacterium]
MNLADANLWMTRRQLLGRSATGIGVAALMQLLQQSGFSDEPASTDDRVGGLPGLPHFAPKAKRVIMMIQNGAPSHVDLFDWKPELAKRHGQPIPEATIAGKRFSTMTGQAKGKLMLAPIEKFHQRGESGAWVSELLPHIASIADELTFVKGMHTDAVNHAPAISFLLSGAQIPGRPTLGSWLNYGLGSVAKDLPNFVVMTSISKGTTCGQIFYDFYWGSGFLPSQHQGVKFRGSGDPVLYLSNPQGMSRSMRREWLNDIEALNRQQLDAFGDPEIATRIAQYEMAFKMQASVPSLTDLSDEPESTFDLYGENAKTPGTFAHNCLLARRLAERGVGFVQLMHAGWDQHNSLTTEFYTQCKDTDQASAALVKDLKQRGMLDDTLVVWGGEFGRTPFIQGDINNKKRWGRDHHPYAYTMWMAGGGTQPGVSHGETDEFSMNVVKDGVHTHDLQATLLHLLGIDHEKLTFRFQGRQFRLTDVHGEVVHELLKS